MVRRAAAIPFLLAAFALAGRAETDPNPARLAPTAEQTERAKDLVAKLGDPVFRVRDEATRELRKLGRAALPALDETLQSTADPEVRNRCETLMPAIEEADLKARLECFLADTERKYEHKIRHWPEFSKVTGDTPSARRLFADFFQARENRELIAALALPNPDLEKHVIARRTFLYNSVYRTVNGVRAPPRPEDVFALLFVESRVSITNRSFQYVIQNLLNQTNIRSALTGDDGEAHRRLLAHWMDTRTQYMEVYQAFQLASTLNIKEFPLERYAIKVLETSTAIPSYRMNALTTSARVMGKDALPVLAKGMNDKTAQNITWFFNGERKQHSIQVRDIALTMALIVTDQKLDDYGIEQRNRPTNLNLPETAKFSYMYYAFPDEKTREAAFAKFREWEAKQKPAKPMPPAKDPGK
jgi:hypothetical protein